MRALSRRARSRGQKIAFVPTMGALHEGHLSLVRRARERHRRVAASVFVNPLQFGPREDFARYPRQQARDARLLRSAGADWVFIPSVRAIYPRGFATRVSPGPLADRWEGRYRPGHFTGVLTVVLKLLEIVEPDTLVLGQKDAQQAALVGRMLRDLAVPVRLDVAPIVREPDGLAMSSRNRYLSREQRARAAGIYRALAAGRARARKGERRSARIVGEALRVLRRDARPSRVDYLALVDPRTLEPLRRLDRRGLLLAAVRIGTTRLLDNMSVPAPPRRRSPRRRQRKRATP